MAIPDLKKLSKKFNEQDVEWRVQQSGQGKNGPWALIIPYITNRAIMARLDEAAGPENWKNEFKSSPCGKGYLCGVSIKLDSEWVTRWDGAELAESDNIDDVKTTLSNSMKRTGVQWGIGRYLYQFEAMFADVKICDNRYDLLPGYTYQNSKDKKTNVYFGFQWKSKPLEQWALPVTNKQINKYINSMLSAVSNEELRVIFGGAYKLAISEGDDELLDKFIQAKDEKKQNLIDESESKKESHQSVVGVFIQEKIMVINSALNESSANGLANVALAEAKNLTNGDLLKEAMRKIKTAAKSKINELNGV